MPSSTVRILLVTGSTRGGSTNTAALRAAHAAATEGVATSLYDRLDDLPHFNPDDDHDPLPPVVRELRDQIAAADGILFCTPEYAGALPGSFKNLLDWTVGGTEMSGKPAAWINVAAEGRGMNAEQSLRTVLGYVGALIVESAVTRVVVSRESIDADGVLRAGESRAQIATAVRRFAEQARTPS